MEVLLIIRHSYTDYEQFLAKIDVNRGKTRVGLLYFILREKVDRLVDNFLEKYDYKL